MRYLLAGNAWCKLFGITSALSGNVMQFTLERKEFEAMAIEKKSLIGKKEVSTKNAAKAIPTATKLQTALRPTKFRPAKFRPAKFRPAKAHFNG